MFIKPQIMSTPHLVGPLGDTMGQACGSGYSSGCTHSFSCSPYQGGNCIDATYVDPLTGGVIGVVVGAVVGTVVIVAK